MRSVEKMYWYCNLYDYCLNVDIFSETIYTYDPSLNYAIAMDFNTVALPVSIRAEGIKLFPDFHHFACFIQYIYVCRFRKSLYEIPSFPQKSENPLQKVSDLL